MGPIRFRRGFISLEPLIFLAWIGIAAAILLPMLVWARDLALSQSMGFGAALWIVMQEHWIRGALVGICLLAAVMIIVVNVVDIVTSRPADPEDDGGES